MVTSSGRIWTLLDTQKTSALSKCLPLRSRQNPSCKKDEFHRPSSLNLAVYLHRVTLMSFGAWQHTKPKAFLRHVVLMRKCSSGMQMHTSHFGTNSSRYVEPKMPSREQIVVSKSQCIELEKTLIIDPYPSQSF